MRNLNKKRLLGENASFFAEIERKSLEISTLKLKLEEKENKIIELEEQNRILTDKIGEFKKFSEEAERKIKELEAREVTVKTVYIQKPYEERKEIEEEENSQTNTDIKEVIKNLEETEIKEEETKVPVCTISEEQREELRKKGALAIAQTTKAVALITSQLESLEKKQRDDAFSLALGKNESFKIQISAVTEKNGVFEELLEEIEKNTKETVESILNIVYTEA